MVTTDLTRLTLLELWLTIKGGLKDSPHEMLLINTLPEALKPVLVSAS